MQGPNIRVAIVMCDVATYGFLRYDTNATFIFFLLFLEIFIKLFYPNVKVSVTKSLSFLH